MYYDALTLAAVKDEMAARILGGRVQKIVQPSELSIGLEIFAGQRYQVLLDATPRSSSVLLMDTKLRRGIDSPSPLLLLLLKYVRDARLQALQQPPLERVLRLTFNGEYGPVDLVCETMGRYSNLVLVGPDNLVMDALKRVTPAMNRYRSTLPKHPYVPPPAQDKRHPFQVTPATLQADLGLPGDEPLWQRLVNGVAGISPILAREIVYRATGSTDPDLPLEQDAYTRLWVALNALLRLPETHAWSPCLAFEGEDESRHPVAYAPYELTHLADREPVERISTAIDRVLEAQHTFDAYKQVRLRLHSLIAEQVDKQRARLASLQRSLVPEAEIEALQHQANAILAMAWAIKPRQTELVIDLGQFAPDAGMLPAQETHIPLDPALSPADNAQKLFHTYRKMKAAAQEVPQLIVQVELALAYLEQLHTEVDLAENRPQLDEVERELREAGYLVTRGKESKLTGKSQPLSLHAEDGTLILVGRNSRQNDEVTFRRGAPDDIWLHAHGVPGSHVVIKCGGGPVAEGTLLLAARLAALYSAVRQAARVQVDWTARRHVRHIKDAQPGMVTYDHEQTLVVAPEKEDLAEEF
jgi:predicted ribosome quality control (RQC) complex YloA/Tae2 family protein